MTVKTAHRFIQISSLPALRSPLLTLSSTSPKTPAPFQRDPPFVVFRESRHKPSRRESTSQAGAAETRSRFVLPSHLHRLQTKLRRVKSRHNIAAQPFLADRRPSAPFRA